LKIDRKFCCTLKSEICILQSEIYFWHLGQ